MTDLVDDFDLERFENLNVVPFYLCLLPSLKKANIGFEHMFEEVPIIIKNSHLINVLMWDLEDKSTVADKHELLNLSSRSDFTHLRFSNE